MNFSKIMFDKVANKTTRTKPYTSPGHAALAELASQKLVNNPTRHNHTSGRISSNQ